MKLQSKTNGVVGIVTITKYNTLGKILEKISCNLIVSSGKAFIASRIIGTAQNPMSHMALGSNSTGAVNGDSTLGTELGRVVLTSATSLDNVVTYTATFGAGVATGGIQEAGIFNASSAATMGARTTFPIVNKSPTDILAVSWTWTIL